MFDRVTDVVYLPSETEAQIVADAACELALPSAPARRRRDVAYIDAREVAVEVRGAGRSTRQVTNFLTPEVDIPDRLSCCEVLTPPGNWSSYPPHKHDDASNGIEAELEEIYYFRVEGPHGMAAHRTYDLVGGVGRDGDDRRRRRLPGPARLPRAVHGVARPRALVPERPGRAGRGAVDGDQRRPGPRLDPRRLGGRDAETRGCRW